MENILYELTAERDSKTGMLIVGSQYKSRWKSLQFNLKDKSNVTLRSRVLSGVITPRELVTMPVEDLGKEERKAVAEEIRRQSLFESVKVAETDNFYRVGRQGELELVVVNDGPIKTATTVDPTALDGQLSKRTTPEIERVHDESISMSVALESMSSNGDGHGLDGSKSNDIVVSATTASPTAPTTPTTTTVTTSVIGKSVSPTIGVKRQFSSIDSSEISSETTLASKSKLSHDHKRLHLETVEEMDSTEIEDGGMNQFRKESPIVSENNENPSIISNEQNKDVPLSSTTSSRVGSPVIENITPKISSLDALALSFTSFKSPVNVTTPSLLPSTTTSATTMTKEASSVSSSITNEEEGKEEKESLPSPDSKSPSTIRPETVWSGSIFYKDIGKFITTFHQLCGPNVGNAEIWDRYISSNIVVDGRASTKAVSNYLKQVQSSDSKDLIVVEFERPIGEGGRIFEKFENHLIAKDRFGVVKVSNGKIKDFYIVPVSEKNPLPDVIQSLPDWIQRPIPPALLGVFVMTKQSILSSLESNGHDGNKEDMDEDTEYDPFANISSTSTTSSSKTSSTTKKSTTTLPVDTVTSITSSSSSIPVPRSVVPNYDPRRVNTTTGSSIPPSVTNLLPTSHSHPHHQQQHQHHHHHHHPSSSISPVMASLPVSSSHFLPQYPNVSSSHGLLPTATSLSYSNPALSYNPRMTIPSTSIHSSPHQSIGGSLSSTIPNPPYGYLPHPHSQQPMSHYPSHSQQQQPLHHQQHTQIPPSMSNLANVMAAANNPILSQLGAMFGGIEGLKNALKGAGRENVLTMLKHSSFDSIRSLLEELIKDT